ncbi:hypothetical protein [Legionella sainthelensi]|uniref:hypothetical protein n=1 Tax=Legionella sainthelensi TaxID=28087 RepID=UPI0004881BF9|nr:hypothetical protein [Legionella sainthelensi]
MSFYKTLVIGNELSKILSQENFEPNNLKSCLSDQSGRQIVTGLVVNKKLNVPKEYLKEIRAMLYSWEKFGLEQASDYWLEKFNKKIELVIIVENLV